jgi:hypothetical protein
MLEVPKTSLLPDPLFIDIEFALGDDARIDPLALCVVENQDQQIGDFVPAILVFRVDQLGDFPIQFEEHRRIGAVRECLIRPILDFTG